MNTQNTRNKLEHKKGQASQIATDLKDCQKVINGLVKEIEFSEKAQGIIQAVARATQSELEYRITEPVSLALEAVYDNPYKMAAKFEITGRGTTECHLGFERNGNTIKPTDSSGGGPIDIASYALRISCWSLSQPRSRPVLILDEPFRFVSRNKMPLAGQMLKETSRQLGLQIIIITHIPELMECADRIINVSIKDGISKVKIDNPPK
jgi:DNA repair exonuclease SbcCD ATPase subunit